MSFIIYTKANCPFCTSAKQLIESRGLMYTELVIGTDITLDEVKEKFPDRKSVPIIVEDNGTMVGGFTQLKEKVESNDPTNLICG